MKGRYFISPTEGLESGSVRLTCCGHSHSLRRMMRLRAFLTSLLLLLPAVDILAVELHGLYEAEVPVADQSLAARRDATARALSRVLVKVSGYGEAGRAEALDAAQVAGYVQQYRYRQVPPGKAGEPEKPELALWVKFDARGVDDFLRGQGIPVWGAARPLTLIWLAVEQGGSRELVGANDGGAAREVLADTGERRGLPVRLPLLDLTDQSRVRPADIWGDFHQPIVEVSQRYNPQAVLVGRLYPLRGSRWAVRWSLYQGDRAFRWSGEGESTRSLLALGVEGAADRLSRALVSSPELIPGDGRLELDVTGIADLAGFQRTLGYLSELNVIANIEIARVDAETVRFSLQVDGGTSRLVKTLALGDTLTSTAVPELEQEQGSRRALLYRLVP